MRHFFIPPIPVTPDGMPPKELTMYVFEDDQPNDPEHSCAKSNCTPPKQDTEEPQ
jgi:hypothetical protein